MPFIFYKNQGKYYYEMLNIRENISHSAANVKKKIVTIYFLQNGHNSRVYAIACVCFTYSSALFVAMFHLSLSTFH